MEMEMQFTTGRLFCSGFCTVSQWDLVTKIFVMNIGYGVWLVRHQVIIVVVVVFIDTERSVLTHESYKTYNTHVKTSNWTINFDDKNTQQH